ncbi:MAG: 16S rRNA (uracil(1498)-N(3))-methyltransferase [SAR324 cluster bacterium]|nr:16S rRNA (uracil(1498)-N(3))-methyltransferase [SAR324 cluster bacterium]
MSYFLFDQELEEGKTYILSGEEAHHILTVRRVRVHEMLELQDIGQRRFLVRVTSVDRKSFEFQVLSCLKTPDDSPLELELVQALVKEKALDLILQKTTELGVSRILIFHSCHTPKALVSSPEQALDRWRKIVQEACKQCGRTAPPEILWASSLEDALNTGLGQAQTWLLKPDVPLWKPQALSIESLHSMAHRILVGPEGGFHPEEYVLAEQFHVQPIPLGPRILRAETAAIAAVSIFQFWLGDLNFHG